MLQVFSKLSQASAPRHPPTLQGPPTGAAIYSTNGVAFDGERAAFCNTPAGATGYTAAGSTLASTEEGVIRALLPCLCTGKDA